MVTSYFCVQRRKLLFSTHRIITIILWEFILGVSVPFPSVSRAGVCALTRAAGHKEPWTGRVNVTRVHTPVCAVPHLRTRWSNPKVLNKETAERTTCNICRALERALPRARRAEPGTMPGLRKRGKNGTKDSAETSQGREAQTRLGSTAFPGQKHRRWGKTNQNNTKPTTQQKARRRSAQPMETQNVRKNERHGKFAEARKSGNAQTRSVPQSYLIPVQGHSLNCDLRIHVTNIKCNTDWGTKVVRQPGPSAQLKRQNEVQNSSSFFLRNS